MERTFTDGHQFYYYDVATGALVAVIGSGNTGTYNCGGGPSQFAVPAVATCSDPVPVCPMDMDGGTSDGQDGTGGG